MTNQQTTEISVNVKDFNNLFDNAGLLIKDLEKALLMLSDVLNTIDTTEPVPQMFIKQAARYAHIASDYTLKSKQGAAEIFNKLNAMRTTGAPSIE